MAYFKKKDHKSQMKHAREAFEIFSELSVEESSGLDLLFALTVHKWLGVAYGCSGQFEDEFKFKAKALEEFEALISPEDVEATWQAHLYMEMGVAYFHRADHVNYLQFEMKALGVLKSLPVGEHFLTVECLKEIANAFAFNNQMSLSSEYTKRALEMYKLLEAKKKLLI